MKGLMMQQKSILLNIYIKKHNLGKYFLPSQKSYFALIKMIFQINIVRIKENVYTAAKVSFSKYQQKSLLNNLLLKPILTHNDHGLILFV